MPNWLEDKCLNSLLSSTTISYGSSTPAHSTLQQTSSPDYQILIKPKNTAVLTNTPLTLSCDVRGYGVKWNIKNLQSATQDISINENILDGMQHIYQITETYNLKILQANSQSAGIYGCTTTKNSNNDKYLGAFLSTLGKYIRFFT